MRMRLFSALLVLPLAGACATKSAEVTEAERAEITAQVESTLADLYDAMNAHDADRVMAHYLPTDSYLYAGVSSTLQGWKTLSQLTDAWYASHPDATFTYTVLHVQVLAPDVATITAEGSSSETPNLLWTRTLVHKDGAWLVALEHESWPGGNPPQARHPMS